MSSHEEEIQKLRVRTVTKLRRPKERVASLTRTLNKINETYGDGSIQPFLTAGQNRVFSECISTGFQEIDDVLSGIPVDDGTVAYVTGSGRGLPRGRIIEVFGAEGSGKTTWTLHTVAAYQRQGYTVAFIDQEHALDPAYAERIGVDMEELLFSQPDTAQQAMAIMDMLVRTSVDLIVLDSVSALSPEEEQKGEILDSHVALQARLLSQGLRILTSKLRKTSTASLIFTNQPRLKIVTFGNPNTTTGGKALRHYASIRMDFTKVGQLKHKSKTVGNRTRIKVVKNKIAPPFRECYFDIRGANGITECHRTLSR